ncbi:MAG: TlpA family protein disulfide reductase [Pedobacter sp.]|nr:MAG: TlpA family protein disulfide reductase [Pedobacter sp.]
MFKKITAFAVMAVLCLCFAAFGQSGGAVEVTAKGIQVGQMVPDVVLSGLHNYKGKDGKVVSSARLSDFRGKLLILDFWATWCSPCVAMIPRMDSLQRVFGDKVQFLSVAYQSDREVLPFIEKLEKLAGRKYAIPMINGEKILHKMFPHTYLPHYVWIDKDGKLGAIGGLESINGNNITRFLAIGKLLTADGLAPLDSSIAKQAKKMISSMKFSTFDPEINGGFSLRKGEGGKPSKFVLRNNTIHELYNAAYGNGLVWYGRNRVVLEVADTARIWSNLQGADYRTWQANGNAFCYEQEVEEVYPLHRYKFMQHNLAILFPSYRCLVEKRLRRCLMLRRTTSEDLLKTKGGMSSYSSSMLGVKMVGYNIGRFVSELNLFFLGNSSMPVINGTEYQGLVDMELNVNPSNIGQLNIALGKYGLSLKEEEMAIDVLVISDRKEQP